MATTDTDKPTAAKSDKPAAGKAKKFIAIYNNAVAHRVLQLRGKVSGISKTHVAGPTIKLMTGATIVERRLWDQWKEQNADKEIEGEAHRGQASILLEERIPFTAQRNEGEGQPWLEEGPEIASEKNPLADLDDKQARDLVARMLDAEQLRRWLPLCEGRKSLTVAIAEKLEERRKADGAGKAGVAA